MKTLKILALSVLLVTGINAKSFAGSADFAGPYIGVTGSVVGAVIDGKHTDGDTDAVVTKGQAGAVSPTAGFEAGYNIAIGDMAFVTIAVAANPFDASFKADDAANANDVTVDMSDMLTASIEPSFSVTDSSALFVKAGYTEFSVTAKGTGLDATQSFDLSGESFGVGTKTITANGIYIKTEIGIATYDGFKLINVGTDDGTATVSDIETAYGTIMIGKKF